MPPVLVECCCGGGAVASGAAVVVWRPKTVIGIALLAVSVLVSSITTLTPIEVGLKYNHLWQTIDPKPVLSPGMSVVGPFTSLIRFPRTVQTIQFTQTDRDLMDGRTSDGLPVVVGLAFQYRIRPESVYHLYREYGLSYKRVYKLLALHVITEMCCRYSAYEFFNEKQKIAEAMQERLNTEFSEKLSADVYSLQILEDDLPEAFSDMVLGAATTKQQIQRQMMLRDAMVVSLTTDRIIAEFQANVTIQGAFAQKANITQTARADAAIIEAFVGAEMKSYGHVKSELGLPGDNLVDYMWYDSLAGGGVVSGHKKGSETDIMVGVEPNLQLSMN